MEIREIRGKKIKHRLKNHLNHLICGKKKKKKSAVTSSTRLTRGPLNPKTKKPFAATNGFININ
ncbi:hypothetical protein B0A79_11640 [Flavobacterium piscis]|uniref:Uncharacterized protein n=1 Tax=Flavobacterium piscis TaxID=1114874 RepID=A0ABX2XNN9_9FLAO|nr:hypothetical protein FLP_01345 [Flavobacterium piscis]OXG04786.1 hypothetical protein B0A79_11640 [Flavobacterium piscis]